MKMSPRATLRSPAFRRNQASLISGASIAICLAALVPSAHAVDGTWNSTTSGLWSAPVNWLGGEIANGIDAQASFDLLDLTQDMTVQLDTPRTIGNLLFGDLDTGTAAGWIIGNNDTPANVLTLAVTAGSPTITVNALGTGKDVTINAVIAGTSGLTKAGTGTLVLNGANTLSGGITLGGGVLAINGDGALGAAGSGLTFAATSTLRLNASTTMDASRTITINSGAVGTIDTQANVAEIASTLTGAGALTKIGSGTLVYTGTGTIVGALAVNGGVLQLEAGSTLATGALTTAAGAAVQLYVNGGSYTSSGMSTINATNPVAAGFLMDSGSAKFSGGIRTSGTADNSIIRVNGGDFTAASVNAQRDTNSPTNFTRGFIFTGGTGLVGTMGAGTTNSWGHLSIEGGTFTATGAITVGNQVTSGRGGAFRVTGGTFTSTDTVDGIVLSKSQTIGANTNTANNAQATFSGGTSTVEKFTLGFDNTVTSTATTGVVLLNLTGGNLYIGSGGIVKNGSPNVTVNLNSGLLGAKADWASAVGVSMGTTATSNVTIKAADEADAPHNITINGPLGGAGGFTKTGGGAMIIGANSDSYTGGTVGVTIAEGTLQIGNGGTAGNLGSSPVANDGTLAFNRTDTLTFANNVTGSGALAQNGTGVTVLTGALSHTGGTAVNAGTLRLGTTLPGAVTVNNGGALGGLGPATGTVVVNSGGRLAPSDLTGAASGLLTLGNLTLAAGSILDVDFTSLSTYDQVAVSELNGLTLNGAGVNLFALNTTDPWTVPGSYNLFQYTGSLGGLAGTNLNSALTVLNPEQGFSYNFGTNGSFITLNIISSEVVPTWNATGGGSWATAGNWTPSIPNAQNAKASFGDKITAPSTVTLDGNKTVGTLSFANANAYTIAAGTGGTLFLSESTGDAEINNVAGNHVISAPVSLTSPTTVNIFDGGEALTISGSISGAGKLTKTGLGTLILSGTNSNAGGLTLNAGTLRFQNNQALGSTAIIFADESTLQAGANNLAPTNAMVINDGVTGTIDTNGHTLTVAGVISDTNANGQLNKTGAGKLILTGANTYGGATVVSGGTLSVASIPNGGIASPLGQSSSATANLVLNGGTLEYTGPETTTDRLFQVGTAGGTLAASGTGPVTFGGTDAIGLAGTNTARTFTLSGTNTGDNTLVSTIGDNGSGATSLVKSGPGTWMLQSANTFTGETAISGGKLILNNPLALGGSTLNYNNQGGTIDFFILSEATLGGLSGNQNLEFASPFTLTLGNNGQTASYGGALSGDVSLRKLGNGTQALSGANTYTGSTTVTAGTLRLDVGGSITTPTLSVTSLTSQGNLVLDGGSLNVTGTTTLGTAPTTRGFLVVNSGTATFGGDVNMVGDGGRLQITGGEVSMQELDIRRVSASGAEGNLGTVGLVVSGGTTTTTSIGVGTDNSWGFMSVSGGSLTNSGTFVVGDQDTATRGGRLRVSGGSLTSTDVSGLVLGAKNGNIATAEFSGGITTLEKITLVGDDALTGVAATVTLNGGTVFLGSGGIESRTAGGSTATVNLNSGILGAKADWSSAQSMSLEGSGITFQAADAADAPHNIALTGMLSGGGGLTKTGAGNLTLGAESFYSGPTNVEAGNVLVSGAITGSTSVNISGGSVKLAAADLVNDVAEIALAGGTFDTAGFSETVGALTLSVAGTIDLGNGASLLRFADSAANPWSGTLSILNWNGATAGNGTDRLFIGTDANGLTASQLASIQFINPNGIAGSFPAEILPSGEIVTIPEPGAFLALLTGGATLLGFRRRRVA